MIIENAYDGLKSTKHPYTELLLREKEKGKVQYMPDNIGNKGTTLQRGGGNTMVGFPITELKSTNKHTV